MPGAASPWRIRRRVLLRFGQRGRWATVTVSDAVSAPWSWELTSGENPVFPHTPEACYWIGGTHGSLSVPRLALWRHEAGPDWQTPMAPEPLGAPGGHAADPLALQIQNLCDVIRGTGRSRRDGQERAGSVADRRGHQPGCGDGAACCPGLIVQPGQR